MTGLFTSVDHDCNKTKLSYEDKMFTETDNDRNRKKIHAEVCYFNPNSKQCIKYIAGKNGKLITFALLLPNRI